MTTAQIIGLIVVLLLSAVMGFFICKKSKSHTLAKFILLFIFLAIALTWIFAYGYYNAGEFVDYNMNQQGLTDIVNHLYYAFNFAGDKIIFLLSIGVFYAVLRKNAGYKKLVTGIAKKFEGKEIIFALVTSLLITIMTAMLSQTLVVLVFVPFLISIFEKMKLDKVTAFAATFGSILIGNLGLIYGGEGLYWFNYYTQNGIKVALVYRLIVLVISYILFNLFTVMHAKKVLKDKKNSELITDPFMVEKTEKTAKTWPIIVTLCILFILVILGYISWDNNFGIKVFNTFHEWLLNLKIGNFAIFKVLFGSLSNEATKGSFGTWTLFHGSVLLVFLSIFVALISKVKFNEFLESFMEACKKMAKPIALFIGAYMVMIAAYMSPFVPTITNLIFKNVTAFNPYLVSLDALIANIFHIDFGFTGYAVGAFFMSTYSANIEIIHLIFTTMFGFVGLFAPTSGILLIGLGYLDLDYKTWIKYIWIFVLIILAILLVLFTVLTYI